MRVRVRVRARAKVRVRKIVRITARVTVRVRTKRVKLTGGRIEIVCTIEMESEMSQSRSTLNMRKCY